MIKEKTLYISRKSRFNNQGVFRPDTYTIHNTGNNASAINERNNLQNNDGTTSFHSVVDEKEVVRCIPFDKGANHAATVAGNTTSISLEICEGSLEKNFAQTWNNAVEVVAHDLSQLGWGVDRLRQHYHWSGKNCPRYIREHGLWEQFKKEVASKMENKKVTVPKVESCSFPDAQKFVKEFGISDGSNPKDPVTREQVWAMLHRAYVKGVFEE